LFVSESPSLKRKNLEDDHYAVQDEHGSEVCTFTNEGAHPLIPSPSPLRLVQTRNRIPLWPHWNLSMLMSPYQILSPILTFVQRIVNMMCVFSLRCLLVICSLVYLKSYQASDEAEVGSCLYQYYSTFSRMDQSQDPNPSNKHTVYSSFWQHDPDDLDAYPTPRMLVEDDNYDVSLSNSPWSTHINHSLHRNWMSFQKN
jgi:hypothetical protein